MTIAAKQLIDEKSPCLQECFKICRDLYKMPLNKQNLSLIVYAINQNDQSVLSQFPFTHIIQDRIAYEREFRRPCRTCCTG